MGLEGHILRAVVTIGVVSYGLLLAPGAVLIAGLAAVAGKSLAFALSLLSPTHVSRRAVTRAAVGAGLMVWPLAYHVDLDATPEHGGETRALNILHAVQAAEDLYSATHGYYDSLECLVQGSCMPNTPYPSRFLSPELVRATTTGGYRFSFVAGPRARSRNADAISASGVTSYALLALPLEDGHPSRRAFCADATAGILALPAGRIPRAAEGRCLDTAHRLP